MKLDTWYTDNWHVDICDITERTHRVAINSNTYLITCKNNKDYVSRNRYVYFPLKCM